MMKKGFTLIEFLVYITTLVIIVASIISFVVWSVHSNNKAKAVRETLDSAKRAMETMTQEIRETESVYASTSVFGVHPGQLSLETTRHLPVGEDITYIDFYVCDEFLCFKKESQDPIVLISDKVEITNLVFTHVISGDISSIHIDLTVEYKNPQNRSEYETSINLQSTANLRSYE